MEHEHSALERLLQELSWEGKPKHYREGGRGLENVLTVEVFQALDFLPRDAFLGAVLRRASGACEAIRTLAAQAEDATVSLLPGDVGLEPLDEAGPPRVYAQPDVLITSPDVYCMVEAKRFGPGGFQLEQLAKELAITLQKARGRRPLLLLVLPDPPPVLVRSHGRMSVSDAISRGCDALRDRLGVELGPFDGAQIAEFVAVITWDEIATVVDRVAEEAVGADPSIRASLARVAGTASAAIRWHAARLDAQ